MTSFVDSLGYVVIYSADVSEWVNLGENVLGMRAQITDDGKAFLRMDDRVARVIVCPSAEHVNNSGKAVTFRLGWECPNKNALAALRKNIEAAGVEVNDLAPEAWHSGGFSLTDPSGSMCDFYYGAKVDPASQFISPLGTEFITGSEGLGHANIGTPEIADSIQFYCDVLGFQLRETCRDDETGDWKWAFLSPNEREHSIAFMRAPESNIKHLLIEAKNIDDVGRAIDRCYNHDVRILTTLGRHWNDEMISFYLNTPSGFAIEYGCGGKKVELKTWSERAQGGSGRVSLWGHRVILPSGLLGGQIGSD